jgi:flagellar motor protein MotB
VKTYLSGKGVGADRLQTRGLGETRPVASNDDDAGRQRNRRVEVILTRAAPAATAAPAQPSGTSTLTPVQ